MERCLATRLDFYFFCGFDEVALPDHSTLCRFRNWLAQDDTLARLLELINCQLTQKGLKIEKAPAAVIDATIIQTAGGKQRQAIETDENGITAETLPSKDKDARWVKKEGKFTLGYKQHTRTDSESYAAVEVRYVVEQTFGKLHRKFGCKRVRYFGLRKVLAQSHLKAVCLNLLKAANRLRVPAAA